MESDKKAVFHRGEETGAVIATANICEEKQGSSEVEMAELSSTVSLQHMPRKMLIVPPKTFFSYNGNKYYWKGYSDFFAEKTDKLLAQYQPATDDSSDKFGELIVSEGDKGLIDLIVVSAFIVQRRSDARKRAVIHSKIRI